jgi:signal transduction histidine kinase
MIRNESGRPRRLLLVDDNEDDLVVMKRLLRSAPDPYEIESCSTGTEALARLDSAEFDLVLLDYHLPDMTGDVFLERVSGGTSSPVPVAVLTGQENDGVAADVLNRGAVDYLVKGTFTSSGMARVISNSIEKHQVQLELQEKRAALELRNWELETLRDELQGKLAELAEAHNTKDQFMAVMSHEMRTPLNAILGYADLLELEVGGELNEAQRTHVSRIRMGGRHLLDLINDVLDLARADASKLELDIRPVDLAATLEEVVALLESQASAGGLKLKLRRCDEESLIVQADLQRLRQVLMNLVGNAIKFTPEGTVSVECETTSDGRVGVHVRDTGIGIAPDALPLVFTEFFQAEGTLTRARGGSGLGLTIALRLARLMGGDVRATSELGRGSTFSLFLRRSVSGSAPRASDGSDPYAQGDVDALLEDLAVADAKPRATVVAFGGDEAALGDLAKHVAAELRLLWTTRADEVADLARKERATLVVLDISSGRDAAWQAAHSLHEIPELTSTAVLLLPRIPRTDPQATAGIDLGWVSLVPKPFTGEQLRHAVMTAHTGSESNSADGGVCRVLVVDDDLDSRRVAVRFLSEAGASVREAADGETALRMMRRHRPDVVVLDLMMPVLDGFGVLATMRADAMLDTIPVVVLSAKTLTRAEREFLSRTAIRVLQKGEHRLSDVASLVMRASMGAAGRLAGAPEGAAEDPG